jgi:hypothetical protein
LENTNLKIKTIVGSEYSDAVDIADDTGIKYINFIIIYLI